MKVTAVIPARMNSTRFPGKILYEIEGVPMIDRVYKRVSSADLVSETIIATDHEQIFEHCRAKGFEVRMTDPSHVSGTDRCAELAQTLDADIIVNVQGDEPLIRPSHISKLIECLMNSKCEISTLAIQSFDPEEFTNPNVVKLVTDQSETALYFSRSPIPFHRNAEDFRGFLKHIGMYGFRRDSLLEIASLAPSKMELIEGLEQLRWLNEGYKIAVGITDIPTIGVDTPEDVEKVESLLHETSADIDKDGLKA